MLRPVVLVVVLTAIFQTSLAAADPILKPRKYQGPIPQSSFTLRGGFFDGATNEEMINFIDSQFPPPFENFQDDFGTSPVLELTYMHKTHPKFAVRASGYWSALRSSGSGTFVDPSVPPIAPDSLPPALEFEREFNVDLFVLEASGVFFFSDASVAEFQGYAGGGSSVGFPSARFMRADTPQGGPEPIRTVEEEKWSVEPGVHAVLGAFYYFGHKWAVNGEAKIQLMQSKFSRPVLDEQGEPVDVDFIVDYTGFLLGIGITYAF